MSGLDSIPVGPAVYGITGELFDQITERQEGGFKFEVDFKRSLPEDAEVNPGDTTFEVGSGVQKIVEGAEICLDEGKALLNDSLDQGILWSFAGDKNFDGRFEEATGRAITTRKAERDGLSEDDQLLVVYRDDAGIISIKRFSLVVESFLSLGAVALEDTAEGIDAITN